MGTSGAFGGSDTKPWRKARVAVLQTIDELQRATDGKDDDLVGGAAADIFSALLSGDSSVGPNGSVGATNLSANLGALISALRTGPGRAARVASDGGAGVGSGRGAVGLRSGARQGGRAIGAGYAAMRGDAAALAEAGLQLSDLQGLSPLEQIYAIVDTVVGNAANTDEQALKNAVVIALQEVTSADPADAPPPLEVLRDFVGNYALARAMVEIEAMLTAAQIDAVQALRLERGIETYVSVRVEQIELPATDLFTTADFENAADLLLGDVLHVLHESVE